MNLVLTIMDLVMNMTASKSQAVSKQLITTIRKLIIFLVISLGSIILFCVGFSMAISELAKVLNRNTEIGIILSFTSLIILFFCLRQKSWLKAAAIDIDIKNDAKLNKNTPSPIEEALGLLINDIVLERQQKRNSSPPPADF